MLKILIWILLSFYSSLSLSVESSLLLDKLKGKDWQPEHSFYGRTSWEYCKLSFSDKKLQLLGKQSKEFEFKVLKNVSDSLILELAQSSSNCYHPKVQGNTFWRFDTKHYYVCNAWTASSKCPKNFASYDKRQFEVSVFETFADAEKYSKEPIGFHGYFEYKEPDY